MITSSFSQHSLFKNCPLCWYNKYVLKLPATGDMSYADGGNVVHHTLDNITKGNLKTIEEIKEFFNKEWNNYKLDTSIIKLQKDDYWLMILNGMQIKKVPTTSELKIMFNDVIGFLDGVNTNTHEVWDYKSSKRTEEKDEEYKQQLTMYSWLYFRQFGVLPVKTTIFYLRYNGSKGELVYIPTLDDITKYAESYTAQLKEMEVIKLSGQSPNPNINYPWHIFPVCKSTENKLPLTFHIYGNIVQIDGHIDEVLHKGLTKKLSYELKNAHWIKKNYPTANTIVNFWNRNKRIFPYGFYYGIKKTIKDYSEFKKLQLILEEVDYREFNEEKIVMPDKFINGRELRDYQLNAVDEFIKNKLGILELGTGAGKTEIAIEIIRRLNMKTLFVVDKRELLKQTKKRIEDSLGIEVGVFGSGDKQLNHITVATIQSLVQTLNIKSRIHKQSKQYINSKLKAELDRFKDDNKLKVTDDDYKFYKEVLEKNTSVGKSELALAMQPYVVKFTNEMKELVNYLKGIRFGIFDECLNKYSKIMLSTGEQIRIDKLYNDDNITEVLSFNEQKQIFESKKILRRIKQPMYDSWWHLIVKDELGNKHKLVLTSNHKIWTNDGYKQVSDLTTNDILKVNLMPIKYKCKICNKLYDNKSKFGNCMGQHKHPDRASLGGKAASKKLLELRQNKDYDLKIRQTMKDGIKNAQKNEKYWINKKEMGLKRKGKNNPVFKDGVIERIKKSKKLAFEKLSDEKQKEQIFRFTNSYRIMPSITKPEQIIIDMNISNLKYNSLSKNMIKFKNGKWKIPDFIIINENKVIEVSDFEHWRTKEESNNIINNYNEIGYKCLYLDKNDLYNKYEETKKIIEKFCYNHYAKVIEIKKSRKKKNSYKYNLEIEDNHNYIANRLLVSNCHKVAAKSYVKLSGYLPNTEFRLGASGTAFRDDGDDMKITAVTGYKLMEINSSTLINSGWLIQPTIMFYKDYMNEDKVQKIEQECKGELINPTLDYRKFYEEFICNNEDRNKVVVNLVNKYKNKKVLILVKLINHGKLLEGLIEGSKYLYGSTSKTERDDMFNKFVSGEIKILISTISIFSEGIDIPSLDIVINASANKGDVKTIQVLGRVLRRLEGKSDAYYIDFVDESKFFKMASYKRRSILYKEGHEVITMSVDK